MQRHCCPSIGYECGLNGEGGRFEKSVSDSSERVFLIGGKTYVGTDQPIYKSDGESPARPVSVRPFSVDTCAVTNGRFQTFVRETGYTTDAERLGWSYVFFKSLPNHLDHEPLTNFEWWRKVDGATWRYPDGEGSSISDRMDHPVVHVSWNDARSFASWAGGSLPSEIEWEFSAKGGNSSARYPWGDKEPDDKSFQPCNIWQGLFPSSNLKLDGYFGTAPARSFPPNSFGLFNVIGNTWEWTRENFKVRSLSRNARRINEYSRSANAKLLKGGSFLCHKDYCLRYRIAARTQNSPSSSTGHIGFRLVYHD